MLADSIVWLLILHTVQVAAVAGVVGVFVRMFATDRPHLAHALWALVLLKAITPPVFASPTSPFSWLGSSHYHAMQATATIPNSFSSVPAIPPDTTIEWSISETMRVNAPVQQNEVQSEISQELSYSPALSAASMIVLLWLAGCLCVGTITAIRIRLFATRVRNSTVKTPQYLSQAVQRLSKRLGLNRQVHIKVVDCSIGPAVIGLFHPTLLLPKIIVDQQSNAELEPLVAHELVHIRRGDLCWALVQSMSVCVCWFHPLVWLAQRLVTQESERSCDEETIASLNCSPAEYARSLLNVLEQKQLLQAAPSLPGIRPVDVTANRMERIMRLGHGCHARSPWWVVATLLVGAACTLPGAALVIGQESDLPLELPNGSPQQDGNGASSEKPAAPIDAHVQESRDGRIIIGDSVDSDLGVAGQVLIDESQFATPANLKETLRVPSRLPKAPIDSPYLTESSDEPYSVESIEVSYVLQVLQEQTGVNADQAAQAFLSHLPFSQLRTKDGSSTSNRATAEFLAEGTDEVCVLGNTEPTMKIVGGKLYFFETAEKREQIRQAIARFREFGFKQISMRAQIIEMKLADLEELDLFGQHNSVRTASASRRVDFGVPVKNNRSMQLPFKTISEEDEERLLNLAKSGNQAHHISRPSFTALNGQGSSCRIGQSFAIVSDYRKNEQTGKYEPITTHVEQGIQLDLVASVARIYQLDEEGRNQRTVEKLKLSGSMQRSNIDRIDESSWSGGDANLKIQVPKTRSSFVEFETTIDKDERLALAMNHADEDGNRMATVTIIRCEIQPPMAIPAANLNATELQNALVGVSDELSDAEFSAFETELKKLGVSKYRRVEGRRMTISIDEGQSIEDFRSKHRLAAEFFQTLRAQRKSAKDSASATKDALGEFDAQFGQSFGTSN